MDLAYNELLDFYGKYISYYRELLAFENKKFSLVLEDNIAMLEKALEDEQALMMRGDAYEKKRIKLQMDMGLGERTFEEIIAVCPEAYKLKFAAVNQELTTVVFEIKKINLLGNELVREKLETIAQITNKNKGAQTYDRSGQRNTYDEGVGKKRTII